MYKYIILYADLQYCRHSLCFLCSKVISGDVDSIVRFKLSNQTRIISNRDLWKANNIYKYK